MQNPPSGVEEGEVWREGEVWVGHDGEGDIKTTHSPGRGGWEFGARQWLLCQLGCPFNFFPFVPPHTHFLTRCEAGDGGDLHHV